jgi:hypothetical protein
MALKRVSLPLSSSTLSPHNPLIDGGSLPQIGYRPRIATEPYIIQEVLPRIERMGLRQQQR